MNESDLVKTIKERAKELEIFLIDRKKKLGAKSNDDPEVKHLEALIKAANKGNGAEILEIAVPDLKNKKALAQPTKGRVPLQEMINEAYRDWIIKSKETLYEPNSPIKLYSTPKGRQKKIDALKVEFLKNSNEWLAHELAFASTRFEELFQHNASLQNEVTFLAEKFRSFYSSRAAAVGKQVKGKEARFKENNDELKAAFDRFEKNLGRAIVPTDFTLYFVTLEYYFPNPPAPESSEFGGETWALKTVRNYFEKRTGLKSTFSKAQAAKLNKEHFSDNR